MEIIILIIILNLCFGDLLGFDEDYKYFNVDKYDVLIG